ncbi:MAG: TetR/AcrR family transcriptional regulator [Ruminococcaceae bacterium]|nr:TetR/AcrR family transcriptional regulator [Oscillospiraceae bacterium]
MTRAEERQLNYSTILNASIDCFLVEGIDKTSVNDISLRSGLTQMSIYRYFGNKQAIAVAVANQLLQKYLVEHRQRCDQAKVDRETGFDEFSRIVRAYIDTFEAHPEYIRFLQEMTAYSQREELSDQLDYMHFALLDSPLNKPANEALKRGLTDGSVRQGIDVERVSQTLTNLLTGGVNYRILIDESTQIDILRHTAEMIIYYIKAN